MDNAGNNRMMETGWRGRKRRWVATAVSMLAASVFSLGAQTQIDLASQGKRVDFSGASTTKPSKTGTALPGTCSTGESFFKLDAAPGANLYGCTGTNTWTQMSAGSGSLPSMGGQANKVLSNDGSAAQWRSLGGDLTGAPDAATVARIQGRSVGSTAPADGQALIWSNALGRWEPGAGGGGSFALDYTPTRNSATELGLGAIAANAFRVGEVGCAAAGASTFTVTSGTGTLWIAVGSDCTVKVRHNILGVCSANCTAVGSATSFDPGDLPLYQWDVTSGTLAATGTLKLTPYVSRPLAAGANVSFGHTAGVTTINATVAPGTVYHYFPAATVDAANVRSLGGSTTNATSSHTSNGQHRLAWVNLLNTADSAMVFHWHLPFTPSAVNLRVEFINKNACTNCNARVEASIGCLAADEDAYALTYNAATAATITLPSVNNRTYYWAVSPSITGCAANEKIWIMINRDQDHAEDTYDDADADELSMVGMFMAVAP